MPNSDLKVLGEKVRKERKLAGLTQEQLAERCHVSTKHIANIEKGSMNPSYEILLAIARVLPVSLDALSTPGDGQNGNRVKRVQSNLSFLSRSSERNLNGLDPHTGKASDRVLQ